MLKTVGIYTLGCKVNQYESEAIGEALSARGFLVQSAELSCDAYIINTCTVTAESDRKARQFIRRALSHNTSAFVLVTGCLAQVDAESICAISGVDFICGNRNKMVVVDELVALFECGQKRSAPKLDVPSLSDASFERMSICRFSRTRAYVKIEDGCENRCTYCIIPSARGQVRSKPLPDVVSEVKALTEGGCREVVLTGIETASWGRDLEHADLGDLLGAVDAIDGIGRVRLGSLDPSLMKQPFVDRIAALGSLCHHFHLSLQSGSDRILALMKRKYNRSQALAAIERLRAALPDVQFSTDVIVGFPDESEQDFEDTLNFVRRARFLTVHAFPYSPRKGTPAAQMPHQLPAAIKKERLGRLLKLSAEIRKGILEEIVERGEAVNVLFESFENGIATGHTENFIELRVPSERSLHAELLPVRPLAPTKDGLGCMGELIAR